MQRLRILPNCSYKEENNQALLHPGYLWLHQPCTFLKLKVKKFKGKTYPEWGLNGLFLFPIRRLLHFLWPKSSKSVGFKGTRKNTGSRYLKINNFFFKGQLVKPTTPVAKISIICYFPYRRKMFHFIWAKNSFSLLETCKYHSFIKKPPDGNLITVDSNSHCLELQKTPNFENSCLYPAYSMV